MSRERDFEMFMQGFYASASSHNGEYTRPSLQPDVVLRAFLLEDFEEARRIVDDELLSLHILSSEDPGPDPSPTGGTAAG